MTQIYITVDVLWYTNVGVQVHNPHNVDENLGHFYKTFQEHSSIPHAIHRKLFNFWYFIYFTMGSRRAVEGGLEERVM